MQLSILQGVYGNHNQQNVAMASVTVQSLPFKSSSVHKHYVQACLVHYTLTQLLNSTLCLYYTGVVSFSSHDAHMHLIEPVVGICVKGPIMHRCHFTNVCKSYTP